MPVEEFAFDHDDRFALPLRLFGVRPGRAHVRVGDGQLTARFGFFSVRTPLANVKDASAIGPFKAHRALGPRLSLVDRGAMFGTSAGAGVCILFHEPVKALPPIPSPGLTVTVADPDGLVRALRERRT